MSLLIAAMTLLFAPYFGRLTGHRGPRAGLLVGGIGLALGAGLLRRLGAHTAVPALLIRSAGRDGRG